MQNAPFHNLGMKGRAQIGGGGGRGGFDKRREGVAVGRGLVGKHVGEEEERLVGLAETEMGSDQSVVKEGRHPF